MRTPPVSLLRIFLGPTSLTLKDSHEGRTVPDVIPQIFHEKCECRTVTLL